MTMKTEAAGFSKMLVCIYKRNTLPPSSWLLSTILQDVISQKKNYNWNLTYTCQNKFWILKTVYIINVTWVPVEDLCYVKRL
jgi:hypothetical protein